MKVRLLKSSIKVTFLNVCHIPHFCVTDNYVTRISDLKFTQDRQQRHWHRDEGRGAPRSSSFNKKQPSPSHLAWEISPSDGSIPGPQLLSILAFIILFLLWLSQMTRKIISFQVLQTCLHLWRHSRLLRPTIIIMSLKSASGNVSQAILNILWWYLKCIIS